MIPPRATPTRRRILASAAAFSAGAGACARSADNGAAAGSDVRVEAGVVWDAAFKLKADIYRPAARAHAGAGVLMFHGGGWAAGSRAELAWFGHLLAGSGVTAISTDYRLVDGATVFAEDQLRDAREAIRATVANAPALGIDTSRLGVLGGSAGGHLAAMLATDGNVSVRAAALLWAPTDLTATQSELTAAGRDILRKYLQAAKSSSAALSPALRIDRPGACRQWLLMHGDRDELVPVSQSRRLHARLEAAGAQSTYLELAGQAHFPRSPALQRRAARALTTFFEVLNR